MIDLLPAALSEYVRAHTTAEDPLLAELRETTQASLAMPQMQVGPVEGALLRLLVQISGARRILEIGTYSGYSALAMAMGLPQDGRLITCDRDEVATRVARAFFDRSPSGHLIEPRLGDARTTLETLSQDGETFDLVFLDADKENYVTYWDHVVPMVVPGGLIVADNTLWSGKVLAPREPSDHGVVAFNERVRSDPRVDHVLLSVRDGVMLARKHRD